VTLEEARLMCRTLVFGATKETQLDVMSMGLVLDTINKSFWMRLVRLAQSNYTKRSADLAVAGGSFDYSGTNLDAAGVHLITQVELKSSIGLYVSLDYITPNERSKFDTAPIVASVSSPSAFYLLEEKIHFVPTMTSAITIRVEYVPLLADWIEGAQALGGRLKPIHGLIPFTAASALVPGTAGAGIHAVRDRLDAQFEELAQKRVGQPRHIKHTPYGEDE